MESEVIVLVLLAVAASVGYLIGSMRKSRYDDDHADDDHADSEIRAYTPSGSFVINAPAGSYVTLSTYPDKAKDDGEDSDECSDDEDNVHECIAVHKYGDNGVNLQEVYDEFTEFASQTNSTMTSILGRINDLEIATKNASNATGLPPSSAQTKACELCNFDGATKCNSTGITGRTYEFLCERCRDNIEDPDAY